MISIINSQKLQKVYISTGNVLSNQIGRKSNEEFLDALKLTLQCEEPANNQTEFNGNEGKILRRSHELEEKITESGRNAISIGAKIFLNKCKSNAKSIEEAVQALLELLHVEQVDNVVLAYHPEPHEDCSQTANSAPSTPNVGSNANPMNVFKWNSHSEEAVTELKSLWKILERFALDKKIKQLGVADLDLETLKQLYESAQVPPTIAQINLSSCCVVPPSLQEFCTQHDIQLNTHSDPESLVLAKDEFILPEFKMSWALRYQISIKCRGVLSGKGFIACVRKPEEN